MSPFPLVVFLTLAAGPNRTTPPGCRADYESCHEDCTIEYGGGTTKYRALTQCIDKCLGEQDDCTTRHYSLRDAQMDEPSGRGRGKGSDSPARSGSTDEFGDARPAAPRDGERRGVYRATDEEALPPKPEPTPSREPERAPQESARRGVYRTTDEEAPAPKPEPTVSQEPERMAEPEPTPPPRSAAKPPPPAGKKKTASTSASSDDSDIPVFGDKEPKNDAQGDVWPASKAAPSDESQPLASPTRPAAKPSDSPRPTSSSEHRKKDISDWDPNSK